MKELLSNNKLILAGSTLDDSGGFLILNVTELDDAKDIMRNDPSVLNGV